MPWVLHENARFGFTLKYPAGIFTLERRRREIDDRLLTSRDGRALLRISSRPNDARLTVSMYRTSLWLNDTSAPTSTMHCNRKIGLCCRVP